MEELTMKNILLNSSEEKLYVYIYIYLYINSI